MRRIAPLAAVFALVVLTGCDTFDTPLLEPDAALPLIQDARDTNSGVFLLPPINDTDYTRTAPFDIDADPRVEICHLDVQGGLTESTVRQADCDSVFAWWEMDDSSDPGNFITLTTGTDSLYSVNWKTPADSADVAFRGTVLLPKFTFDPSQGTVVVVYDTAARFDVVLYDNSSTQLDQDSIVGFTAGKNFPIKFIVEETSACSGLDCFAYPVTCLGGLFETDHAGVLMPEDWATDCDQQSKGVEEFDWWLFQERLPEGSACVPEDQVAGIAYEPCYVWQLIKEVEGPNGTTYETYNAPFEKEVTVQFCAEAVEDDGLLEVSSVFRYSQTDQGPTVTQLEPGDGDILTNPDPCPFTPEPSGSVSLGFGTFGDRVVRPVLALLGLEPRTLYAGDTGTLSASTIRMSEFQRFVELNELVATTALSPTVILGGSAELGVRLTSPPHHEPYDVDPAGVGGVMIRFEVDGDATISTSAQDAETCDTEQKCLLVPTSSDLVNAENVDEAGFASVLVTVGSTTGTFSVNVTVPVEPDLETLTFNVEAVDLIATFLEPLETGDFYGSPDELFTPMVYICEVDATPCTATTAHQVIPTSAIKLVEDNGRKFYQADWKPRDTGGVIGTRYTAQILADGSTVGYSIPIEVTKGGKSERVEDVYFNGANSSVPLKFTITRVDPVQ